MGSAWWQDEQFWRDLMPFLFTERSFQYGEDEVDELLELVDVPDGGRILDAGCGPGRLLIPLVQRGYQVVGFDICAEYRRQARLRAARLGLSVDVRAMDGFQLEVPDEPFDVVLDFFALLGYHADPVADILLVKSFRQALRPGGQVAIQARSPSHTTGVIRHRSDRGGLCIEERRYDRDSRIMHTAWTMTLGGRQRAWRSQVRVYPPEDIRGLLEFCEFTDVSVYEVPGEQRVVATATRPAQDVSA